MLILSTTCIDDLSLLLLVFICVNEMWLVGLNIKICVEICGEIWRGSLWKCGSQASSCIPCGGVSLLLTVAMGSNSPMVSNWLSYWDMHMAEMSQDG